MKPGFHDPFALLTQVVKKGYTLPHYAPSSLENNAIVMQILEAAKLSAQSGQAVQWSQVAY